MENKDINCLFCDDENIKKRYIYKNNYLMAFPTNIPITFGHTLICPTRHIVKIDDLSDNEIIAIKNFIVKLKKSLVKAFGAEGFNIAWNEGDTSGQKIKHLHIHIVPRKKGDTGIYKYEPRKFLYRPGDREETKENELKEIAEIIKKNIK